MPLTEIDPASDISDAEHQRLDEMVYADVGGGRKVSQASYRPFDCSLL